MTERIQVTKTHKLFINGAFPRSESGRSAVVIDAKGKVAAHLCRASRKDVRDAVTAAAKAQPSWAERAAYNRSQILYRMGEMLEGKSDEFIQVIKQTTNADLRAARKQVAASDWEGRVDDLNDHAKQFALREPHIESAQASLGSSKTQLTKARRDLSRSRVQAPFDALVIDAPVELGQVVSPQVKLATLVAVDRYWVQVSVPVSHLEFLAIPGVNTKSDGGSRAQVVHNSGGVFIERPGHVERLEGAVDSRGRMAKLLVAIDDPLQLAKPESERGLPLLLGSYVRVALAGTVAQDTVALPREALRDGNSVFLVVDGKLMPQPIEIAWRTRESVLVRGLSEGDLVVISPLAAPTEGMEVTVSEEHSEFGAPGREELVNVAPAPAGGNKD